MAEEFASSNFGSSQVAADLYHMLAHALRYYKHLGLDLAARGRVVVHNASTGFDLAKAAGYLDTYGVGYWVSNRWSSATKRQAANAFLATLPGDAYLVYPDLDEFFAYPCEVTEVMDRGACCGVVPRRAPGMVRLRPRVLESARGGASRRPSDVSEALDARRGTLKPLGLPHRHHGR